MAAAEVVGSPVGGFPPGKMAGGGFSGGRS